MSAARSDSLPEFVQKQAETALVAFLHRRDSEPRLDGEVRRTAILIREILPHPLTLEDVRLPIALMVWRDDQWRLYFRGTRGRWQSYPALSAQPRPEPLLAEVAEDQLGIFWRQ